MLNGCLTLDIGNTNASLAAVSFAESVSLEALGGWGRGDDEGAQLAAALARFDGSGQDWVVGVSVVGSAERESVLVERLRSHGYEVLVKPDAGLAMEIRHPETCGSDRQYAVRAALEDQQRSLAASALQVADVQVLVVDAGTALTVDAGVARVGEGGGMAFLGGAIAMGPGSLAAAITERGARLAEFVPDPDAPALGRSTVEALQAGVSVGFRGAVRELCVHVQREAFDRDGAVAAYLTGGARGFARTAVAESFPGGYHESAHLVHVGLAHAVRSAVSSRG